VAGLLGGGEHPTETVERLTARSCARSAARLRPPLGLRTAKLLHVLISSSVLLLACTLMVYKAKCISMTICSSGFHSDGVTAACQVMSCAQCTFFCKCMRLFFSCSHLTVLRRACNILSFISFVELFMAKKCIAAAFFVKRHSQQIFLP
jgi:hypothetical protein